MDLVVYQVMQLEVMHVSDGDRVVEEFACAAVLQPYLTVSVDGNALPEFSVITVLIEIFHDLGAQDLPVFGFEIFPAAVDIVVCHLQGILDVILGSAVEVGCCHVEAQSLGCQGKVDLQDLADVHTGRNAQRIQNDIQGTAVGKVRHIFNGKHAGNDTLVSVTACHLIADGDLSLLGNIDADCLVDAG